MQALRWALFSLLTLAFVAVTGLMLVEWLGVGTSGEDSPSPWPTLLSLHGTLGYLLVAFAAVLVGWRAEFKWVEALGWLGFAALLLAGIYSFGNADAEVTALSTMAPRALFLIALLVWARVMWAHGLLLSGPVALSFLGLFVAIVIYIRNDWGLPDDLEKTHVVTALTHASLYVPMLLTLPAFLLPRAATPRLTLSAWSGAAAFAFLIAAGILWAYGLQGMNTGRAEFTERFADAAREFSLLGFGTLALWLAALWAHRR